MQSLTQISVAESPANGLHSFVFVVSLASSISMSHFILSTRSRFALGESLPPALALGIDPTVNIWGELRLA